MRTFLICIFFFTGFIGTAQEWTQDELNVIKEFNLDQNDSRGIILVSDNAECKETYDNIENAIKDFFSAMVKQDITTYCVTNLAKELEGQVFDLRSIIRLYLTK